MIIALGSFSLEVGAVPTSNVVHRPNRVTFRVNNSVNARLTPQEERKAMELINQSK